jgi:hypothetical protein
MSFFTTSSGAEIPEGLLKKTALSKSGILLDLIRKPALFSSQTSTSNRVAVLRTLPEMVMRASETKGCCSASESKRSLTL